MLFLERHHQVWKRGDVWSVVGILWVEESAELCHDKSWFQIGANCKTFPEDLRSGKELVRRYERSNLSGTTTAALDEEIKTAALEALSSQLSWNNMLP